MSIEIRTYYDPYGLQSEPYWDDIKNAFHLCATQTLVNAMHSIYKDCPTLKFTTVDSYLDFLFEDWRKDSTTIEQHAKLDNKIMNSSKTTIGNVDIDEARRNSLLLNREQLLESLRMLFAMEMNPKNMDTDKMSEEQRILYEIYKDFYENEKMPFLFKTDLNLEQIDEAIKNTIEDSAEWFKENNRKINVAEIDRHTVVVQGVHQFTPESLRMIELLSQSGKRVIMLFHYQKRYEEMFKTWMNVYSAFGIDIQISKSERIRYASSFKTLPLAEDMNNVFNGNTRSTRPHEIEVVEFENITEFAGYVANLFEYAQNTARGTKRSALGCMNEKIYASNASLANDILKIYFPEQFGERQFLDYPIGHFFLAITQMWDPNEKKLYINDLSDVRECLSAGIIYEEEKGKLQSIFNNVEPLLNGCTTIEKMIKKLENHKDNLDHYLNTTGVDYLYRIKYYNVSIEETDELITGLKALNKIANTFYDDFDSNRYNFTKFYQKMHEYLESKVLPDHNLDEEFRDIVKRVLERLETVKDTRASASFECLKQTMQLYLQQTSNPRQTAQWIVKNLEQLDGDILSTFKDDQGKKLHLAMLSDDLMNQDRRNDYPWPLDQDFFEVVQTPVDWKYAVFVTSCREYKNFKRYAMFYGLEFNQMDIKLSYIRHLNATNTNVSSELYYGLKLLNAKTISYSDQSNANKYYPKLNYEVDSSKEQHLNIEYDFVDYQRLVVCPKKVLFETFVDENTIYREPFQIQHYLVVLILNRIYKEYMLNNINAFNVEDKAREYLNIYGDYFGELNQITKIDVQKRVVDQAKNTMKLLDEKSEDKRMTKEQLQLIIDVQKDFLLYNINLKTTDLFENIDPQQIAEEFESADFKDNGFRTQRGKACKTCAHKHICAPELKTYDL